MTSFLVLLVLGMLGLAAIVAVVFAVVAKGLIAASSETGPAAADELLARAPQDLAPWYPSSASELSREWVGASYWTRGAFGQSHRAAARVTATLDPNRLLLCFHSASEKHFRSGRSVARTAAIALEAVWFERAAWLSVNGHALGVYSHDSGQITNHAGQVIGWYRRVSQHGKALLGVTIQQRNKLGYLELYGAPIAVFDAGRHLRSLPKQLTPLILAVAPTRTPEADAWLVFVAVLELAGI